MKTQSAIKKAFKVVVYNNKAYLIPVHTDETVIPSCIRTEVKCIDTKTGQRYSFETMSLAGEFSAKRKPCSTCKRRTGKTEGYVFMGITNLRTADNEIIPLSDQVAMRLAQKVQTKTIYTHLECANERSCRVSMKITGKDLQEWQ